MMTHQGTCHALCQAFSSSIPFIIYIRIAPDFLTPKARKSASLV